MAVTPFDTEATKKINDWLNAHRAGLRCPCGKDAWQHIDNPVAAGNIPYPMLLAPTEPAILTGNGCRTFVAFSCDDCGYTVFVATKAFKF
jgi:hypothetical protein